MVTKWRNTKIKTFYDSVYHWVRYLSFAGINQLLVLPYCSWYVIIRHNIVGGILSNFPNRLGTSWDERCVTFVWLEFDRISRFAQNHPRHPLAGPSWECDAMLCDVWEPLIEIWDDGGHVFVALRKGSVHPEISSYEPHCEIYQPIRQSSLPRW